MKTIATQFLDIFIVFFYLFQTLGRHKYRKINIQTSKFCMWAQFTQFRHLSNLQRGRATGTCITTRGFTFCHSFRNTWGCFKRPIAGRFKVKIFYHIFRTALIFINLNLNSRLGKPIFIINFFNANSYRRFSPNKLEYTFTKQCVHTCRKSVKNLRWNYVKKSIC